MLYIALEVLNQLVSFQGTLKGEIPKRGRYRVSGVGGGGFGTCHKCEFFLLLKTLSISCTSWWRVSCGVSSNNGKASLRAAPRGRLPFVLVNNREFVDFHKNIVPELAKSNIFYPIWPNPNL